MYSILSALYFLLVLGVETPETTQPTLKEIQNVACEDEDAAQEYDIFKGGDWDIETEKGRKAHEDFNLLNGNICFFLQGTVAGIEEKATVDYRGKPVSMFTVFIHKLDECGGEEEVCERREFFILAR